MSKLKSECSSLNCITLYSQTPRFICPCVANSHGLLRSQHSSSKHGCSVCLSHEICHPQTSCSVINWFSPSSQTWSGSARHGLGLCPTTVLPGATSSVCWRIFLALVGELTWHAPVFGPHGTFFHINSCLSPAGRCLRGALPCRVPWHNVCEQLFCHRCSVSSDFQTLYLPLQGLDHLHPPSLCSVAITVCSVVAQCRWTSSLLLLRPQLEDNWAGLQWLIIWGKVFTGELWAGSH